MNSMQKTPEKSYHHGNLRQALIDAAIPVLRKKGVVGLSLRELATELGVSHGAPYRHFRNKGSLLEAIAVSGFETLTRSCISAAQRYPDDPRRQLFEAGLGYLEYVGRNPEVADLMFGAVSSTSGRGVEWCKAVDDAFNALVSVIANGCSAGLYIQRDARDLALATLATVHGLSMMVAGGMFNDERSSSGGLRMLAEKIFPIVLYGLMDSRTSPAG